MRALDKQVNITETDLTVLAASDLNQLARTAEQTSRGLARLCTHAKVTDKLHEMTIANLRQTYIRPHKNLNKAKSFLVLKGDMDVILFDDSGIPTSVVHLGAFDSGKPHYLRFQTTAYHTMVTMTDYVLFQETTTGPFEEADTLFAPWAPEHGTDEGDHYCEQLKAIARQIPTILPQY